MSHQKFEGRRTLRYLHVNGILLDLPSGKIMCVDHKVGSVFRVYGTFAYVFAFPFEIKQPLGSTESRCIRMHNTHCSKSSKTFISWTSRSTCWPDLTHTSSVRRVGYLPELFWTLTMKHSFSAVLISKSYLFLLLSPSEIFQANETIWLFLSPEYFISTEEYHTEECKSKSERLSLLSCF